MIGFTWDHGRNVIRDHVSHAIEGYESIAGGQLDTRLPLSLTDSTFNGSGFDRCCGFHINRRSIHVLIS